MLKNKGVLTKEEILCLNNQYLANFLASRISSLRTGGRYGGRKKALISLDFGEDLFDQEEPIEDLREEALAAVPSEDDLLISSFTKGVGYKTPFIEPLNPDNLDVDGIDFTIGDVIYETNTVFGRVSLKELDKRNLKKHQLQDRQEFVIYPGKVYYIPSKEKVGMPKDLDIFIDSKSTIGRLACICDDATISESLKNSAENLVAVIMPDFFPLKITSGKSRLFQGIFKYAGKSEKYTHMTRKELLETDKIGVELEGKRKSIEDCLDEDNLTLHVSTHKAYVSRKEFKRGNLRNIPPIDVDGKGLNWRDYFEEVRGNKELVLEPGRFYLLGTKEYLRFGEVCGRIDRALTGHLAGLWVQFAGIIHAGFYGEITLECKTDKRTVIRDGDLFGYVKVDELLGKCRLAEAKPSYADQKAPRLPKMFKQEKI